MPDKHNPIQRDKQALSPRSQRLVEHIEGHWLESQISSLETIKNIISTLPEAYKGIGLNAVAERLVNNMKLHMLDTIAKFYQEAEQEGILQHELEETLIDTLQDTNELMELSKKISVHSLDDVLKLSSITSGLYKLSKANNAYDAQRWMYKLHSLYEMKLQQGNLLKKQGETAFTYSRSLDEDTWKAVANLANEVLTNIVEEAQVQDTQPHDDSANNHWNKFLLQPTANNTHIISKTEHSMPE